MRGMAEAATSLRRKVFQAQAQALGLFFDECINTFDPTRSSLAARYRVPAKHSRSGSFQRSRLGIPNVRAEHVDIPISDRAERRYRGASGGGDVEALNSAKRLTTV